jgi:hypothetical protein
MTERDIYFAINTSLYSPDQLVQIYTKYRHISLISSEPISSNAFFDYVSGQTISLEELNVNFDDYTPMSLQKLKMQLGKSLIRWQNDPRALPFQELYERIIELLNKIVTTDTIFLC